MTFRGSLIVGLFFMLVSIRLPAAVPRIYGVSTNSGKIGEVITIFGDDFLPESALVEIGGATATVVSGNVGYLDVRIPGGAVGGPITIIEDEGTATSSSYFNPLPLTAGTLTNVYAQRNITTNSGFQPFAAVADLDGDGKSDIVGAGATSLEIFQNRTVGGVLSSNSFTLVSLPLKKSPADVAAKDLNGDGKPELIFIEGEILKIRQNLIEGLEISSNSFGAPLELSRRDTFSPLRVADVDHDGRLDILVRDSVRGIQVFWNRSEHETLATNDFTNTFVITSNSGQKTQAAQTFEVADLNQDGHADIAAVIGTNLVIFALEDQSGMLRTNHIRSFVLGSSRPVFSVADLNNDGTPDLLVSEVDHVLGYINHSTPDHFGGGSFERVVLISTGYPNVRAADFDGDGQMELLAENRYVFRIVVANGKFVPQLLTDRMSIRPDANIFGLGDFNGDNRPDAVGLVGSRLVVLENISEGAPLRLQAVLRPHLPTFGITGAPMASSHLEMSTDLIHWQPISVVRLNVSGEGSFTDVMTRPRTFYRLAP
jgi:hypothetical protein